MITKIIIIALISITIFLISIGTAILIGNIEYTSISRHKKKHIKHKKNRSRIVNNQRRDKAS